MPTRPWIQRSGPLPLVRTPADGPRVVGSFEAYPAAERKRRADQAAGHRRRLLRSTWPAPKWIGAGIAVAIVLDVLHGGVGLIVAAVMVGAGADVAWWYGHVRAAATGGSVEAGWAEWEQAKRDLARELVTRLDSSWVVLPDRVGEGWTQPLTLIVGPAGVQGFWVQELLVTSHVPQLAAPLAKLSGVGAQVALFPREQWRTRRWVECLSVTRSAPIVLGPREVSEVAGRLEMSTRPEPLDMNMGGIE